MTISWCYTKIHTRVDLSNSISYVARLHHVRTNFEQIYFPVWNFEPSCLDSFLPNTMDIKHPTNDAIIKSTCFSTRCKFEMSNRCFQAICWKRKIKDFRIENVFLSGILHYIFFFSFCVSVSSHLILVKDCKICVWHIDMNILKVPCSSGSTSVVHRVTATLGSLLLLCRRDMQSSRRFLTYTSCYRGLRPHSIHSTSCILHRFICVELSHFSSVQHHFTNRGTIL